ncbi:hypothetical protein NQ317_013764 [Molorchus minor]|uniref:Uncharacterized protein n=1 Tax=Molorchus minor TaxID=1323400 RepID=A0ABQ9JSA2_9CUCU|nr:hypothetical protein NQ317_013764 [Molorchus minor]
MPAQPAKATHGALSTEESCVLLQLILLTVLFLTTVLVPMLEVDLTPNQWYVLKQDAIAIFASCIPEIIDLIGTRPKYGGTLKNERGRSLWLALIFLYMVTLQSRSKKKTGSPLYFVSNGLSDLLIKIPGISSRRKKV